MAKEKFSKFTVNGRGEFPIDMLRHDRCWPVENMEAVQRYNEDAVSVVLYTDDWHQITLGRWKSFGWTVIWIDAFGAKPSIQDA